MEAHGGYFFHGDHLDVDLLDVAKRALVEEGQDPNETSLWVSRLKARRVIRVAYDAPFTYGKRGAHWYRTHHALARSLSSSGRVSVHTYVLDPDEMEEVVSYAQGRKVGGESLVYETVDFPAGASAKLDDQAYQEMLSDWPLGRLARIYGVSRAQLLGLPRQSGVLMSLDGSATSEELLALISEAAPLHSEAPLKAC